MSIQKLAIAAGSPGRSPASAGGLHSIIRRSRGTITTLKEVGNDKASSVFDNVSLTASPNLVFAG